MSLHARLAALALALVLTSAGCGGGSSHDQTSTNDVTSSVGTFDRSTFDGNATLGQ